MKNLLLVFIAFSSLFIFSCSDPCDDINCGPGTCVEGDCVCPDGFSGVNCEIEDLCFNVDCGNGTCDQNTGSCLCDEGYEGDNCEIRIKDKYLGTWVSMGWKCISDPDPDEVTIRFDDMPDNGMQIYLVDPLEDDILILTTIQSESFVIDSQTIDIDGDLAEIEGEGTLVDGKLTLEITLSIPSIGVEDTCLGVFDRQ